MRIVLALLALSLTGCAAISTGGTILGAIQAASGLEWSERATASTCAEGQDLKEVWGVWQCVDH